MVDHVFHAKLRLINGTYFPGSFVPDEKRLQELLNFAVYEDDVWTVSYPKSGTTWMQALVKLVCASTKDFQNCECLVDHCTFLEYKTAIDEALPIVQNAARPREIKTHLPFEFLPLGFKGPNPPKLIYVARNPKDVCVSFYYFVKDLAELSYSGSFENFYDIFKTGEVLYGSWLNHVKGYWNERHRENILFVTYEEMKQNLENVLHRVVSFLDKPPLTSEQVSLILSRLQFENLKKDRYFTLPIEEHGDDMTTGAFMRKGIVGDWMNHLSPEMSDELEMIFQKPMEEIGLVFKK